MEEIARRCKIRCLVRRLLPVVVAAGGLAFPASGAGASHPLETAIHDPLAFTGAEAGLAFSRVRAAGATAVRIQLIWRLVAPESRPRAFRPADPDDPAYRWSNVDAQIEAAVARGLRPFVYIETAPGWALRMFKGSPRPDPGEFGRFARAAAKRYGGDAHGLPRVYFWQAWNEPNKSQPALRRTAHVWYRAMVNSFAAAVHRVHPDNAVVAGGVSPFGRRTAVAPLTFMRRLLCLSPGGRPTCKARTHLDIWSTHPYTSGGPEHEARSPNDVSLGDLPEMRNVLRAAVRAGHVVSHGQVRFWVTEFSWDSSPPDPQAVPRALHARWVAEALYRMWTAGVSLVTWFRLSDDAVDASPYQSGLYYHADNLATARPKLSLRAFRFPFIAFRERRGVLIWGRTPNSKPQRVVLEQRRSGRWRGLSVVKADRYGIFRATVRTSGAGPLRARVPGDAAVPFSLVRPPDHVVDPFGS
jgi:hypothetical protein